MTGARKPSVGQLIAFSVIGSLFFARAAPLAHAQTPITVPSPGFRVNVRGVGVVTVPPGEYTPRQFTYIPDPRSPGGETSRLAIYPHVGGGTPNTFNIDLVPRAGSIGDVQPQTVTGAPDIRRQIPVGQIPSLVRSNPPPEANRGLLLFDNDSPASGLQTDNQLFSELFDNILRLDPPTLDRFGLTRAALRTPTTPPGRADPQLAHDATARIAEAARAGGQGFQRFADWFVEKSGNGQLGPLGLQSDQLDFIQNNARNIRPTSENPGIPPGPYPFNRPKTIDEQGNRVTAQENGTLRRLGPGERASSLPGGGLDSTAGGMGGGADRDSAPEGGGGGGGGQPGGGLGGALAQILPAVLQAIQGMGKGGGQESPAQPATLAQGPAAPEFSPDTLKAPEGFSPVGDAIGRNTAPLGSLLANLEGVIGSVVQSVLQVFSTEEGGR